MRFGFLFGSFGFGCWIRCDLITKLWVSSVVVFARFSFGLFCLICFVLLSFRLYCWLFVCTLFSCTVSIH